MDANISRWKTNSCCGCRNSCGTIRSSASNARSSIWQTSCFSHEEILDLIQKFAHCARIAKDTGFTGVQIHGAHGYLISEFLSPDINLREDEWGGTLEKRAKFLLEIVRAVREAVGVNFPVSLKLNSADFQKGGFSHEDAIQVATWLNEEGLDLLEISGGTYEQPHLVGIDMGLNPERAEKRRESTIAREAYFLDYARDIRNVFNGPLMVTGGFRTSKGMNDALNENACDVIGIARPFCIDSDIANKLLDKNIIRNSNFRENNASWPRLVRAKFTFFSHKRY